jgi:hypothetical protein
MGLLDFFRSKTYEVKPITYPLSIILKLKNGNPKIDVKPGDVPDLQLEKNGDIKGWIYTGKGNSYLGQSKNSIYQQHKVDKRFKNSQEIVSVTKSIVEVKVTFEIFKKYKK